jgi:HD-like signal output (HDOD) protein
VIATAPVADADLKPPAELVQALKKRVGNLQMLPAVAQEALQMVKEPDCSFNPRSLFLRM